MKLRNQVETLQSQVDQMQTLLRENREDLRDAYSMAAKTERHHAALVEHLGLVRKMEPPRVVYTEQVKP